MINFKEIKKDIEGFKKKISQRNINLEFETLLSLDKKIEN